MNPSESAKRRVSVDLSQELLDWLDGLKSQLGHRSRGAILEHLLGELRQQDNDEDELANAFIKRKGFAYGIDGKARRQDVVLAHVLAGVEVAYQNLDSIELGVTTVDHYFDTLGGISRAVRQARDARERSGHCEAAGEWRYATRCRQVVSADAFSNHMARVWAGFSMRDPQNGGYPC